MAFKANAVDPKTGYLYKKDEIYVKVISNGSGKVPRTVFQSDGKTPVIDETTGQPKVEYQWVLDARFMVFSVRTHKPLFDGNLQLPDYDCNQPAEAQIYGVVQGLKWQYWHSEPLFDAETYGELGAAFEAGKEETPDGKVLYPLFTDCEEC